ncbi:Cyclic nucleotide-gated channel subunit beta 1 [Balamuthia mandrillaris]
MEEEEEEKEEKEEEEKKKKQDKKDEKTVEPFELSVMMLFDQTRLRAFHHFCQLQYSSPSTTLRWLLTFDTMAKHLLPINTAQRFLHESAQDAKMQLRTHTSMIYNESEMTSSGQFVPQERLAFGEWNLQRWNKIVQTYFGSIKDQTKEKDKKEEREKEEEENDDGSKTTNFYASVGKEKRMRKTDQVPLPTELHSFFQFFILKIRPWLLVPSTQNPQVNFDPLCIWVGDNGNAMELNYFAKEVYHQVKTFNSFLHITPIQF